MNRKLILMLAAGLLLVYLVPDRWLATFAQPAAYLAASFIGAPCVPIEAGTRIAAEPVPVDVTAACSAARYFILVVAFCLAALPRLGARRLLGVIALAYGITLIANATRIVFGWHVGIWARATLPHNFWGAFHAAAGVLVFLAYLVALHAVLLRTRSHTHTPTPPHPHTQP